MKLLNAIVFSVLVILTACVAENEKEVYHPINIALNKPYTLNIKPNYSYCSDPEDTIQLTNGKFAKDGKREKSEKIPDYFWTNKETVGWSAPTRPIEITIDLGNIEPISGFSLNTAAGHADVNWPVMISVLVSEDGKDFYEVTDLTNLYPDRLLPAKKYTMNDYSVRNLKTKGRYVKFLCMPSGCYFFCDEIEVFSGPLDNLKQTLLKSESAFGNPENRKITVFAKKRMLYDISSLRNELEKSKADTVLKKEISKKLDILEEKVMAYEFSGDPEQFRAVIPVNELHARIIAVFAELLRNEGFDGLNIWHKDRYVNLVMFERPLNEKPQLNIRMMNGEYRADVLNITNCGKENEKVFFTINGLPGNPGKYLKVYEVKGVDSKNLNIDFCALLPVPMGNGTYSVEIKPGMTSQLWFSFHPEDISPGSYNGSIKLYYGTGIIQKIPLKFTVSTVKFPSKTTLKCLLWDYSFPTRYYGIGDKNLKEAVLMLKRYFINIPAGRAVIASIPGATDFDKTGKLIHYPDFSPFNKWLELWSDAAAYHIYLSITPDNQKFAGFTPGSCEFEKAVGEWADCFSKHIKSKGVNPAKVMLHILDEPRRPEHFQIIEKWASAIKKSGSGLSVFSDPLELHMHNNMKYAPSALKSVDILCPQLFHYTSSYSKDICDFLQGEREKGKELWFYMCSQPNRQFDPSYFRLQPWQAFIYDASGSGFWSFSDTGRLSSNWNPYSNMNGFDYSPVYISPDSITTAKQMEAIREGIEDYQYLIMLKDSEKDKDTAKGMALNVIKKTDDTAGKVYWLKWDTRNTPCSFADEARNKILDRLESLKDMDRK